MLQIPISPLSVAEATFSGLVREKVAKAKVIKRSDLFRPFFIKRQ